MLRLNSANEIIIDGKNTQLRVSQERGKTSVYSYLKGTYLEHKMPCQMYSLTREEPQNGIPGSKQFVNDIKQTFGI